MSVRQDLRPTVAPPTVPIAQRDTRAHHMPRWLLTAAIGVIGVVALVIAISWFQSDEETSQAFEPLIGPEEQAFIDDHIRPQTRTSVAVVEPIAVVPDVHITQRPTGIAGQIDPYEWDYIVAHTPFALGPAPASKGFDPRISAEEQLFIAGGDQSLVVEDWCVAHTPC